MVIHIRQLAFPEFQTRFFSRMSCSALTDYCQSRCWSWSCLRFFQRHLTPLWVYYRPESFAMMTRFHDNSDCHRKRKKKRSLDYRCRRLPKSSFLLHRSAQFGFRFRSLKQSVCLRQNRAWLSFQICFHSHSLRIPQRSLRA